MSDFRQPFDSYFSKKQRLLEIFLCNDHNIELRIKPKREVQMFKDYGNCYEIQLELLKEIRNIEMSHLLGSNEVFVPVMVDEYARCRELTKILHKKLQKMVPYKELYNTEELIKECKVKFWSDTLYKDLLDIQDTLGISFDLKEMMTRFKEYKLPEKEEERFINGSS